MQMGKAAQQIWCVNQTPVSEAFAVLQQVHQTVWAANQMDNVVHVQQDISSIQMEYVILPNKVEWIVVQMQNVILNLVKDKNVAKQMTLHVQTVLELVEYVHHVTVDTIY